MLWRSTPIVLLLVLMLATAACDPETGGGGGVIIPTQPLDKELVPLGAIGAGLPSGYLQESTCRIEAQTVAGIFGPEPETLHAVLAFDANGKAASIEQRFIDIRSSELVLYDQSIALTYDDAGRLIRIVETDMDRAQTRTSTLSYAGETSRIAQVDIVASTANETTTAVNTSRMYNDESRLVFLEDRFDEQPLGLNYFYDARGRLDHTIAVLNGGLPLPLAAFAYDTTGALANVDMPALDLCVQIFYDAAGMATASDVAACSGDEVASVRFEQCQAKAIAFWLMFTLQAY